MEDNNGLTAAINKKAKDIAYVCNESLLYVLPINLTDEDSVVVVIEWK